LGGVRVEADPVLVQDLRPGVLQGKPAVPVIVLRVVRDVQLELEPGLGLRRDAAKPRRRGLYSCRAVGDRYQVVRSDVPRVAHAHVEVPAIPPRLEPAAGGPLKVAHRGPCYLARGEVGHQADLGGVKAERDYAVPELLHGKLELELARGQVVLHLLRVPTPPARYEVLRRLARRHARLVLPEEVGHLVLQAAPHAPPAPLLLVPEGREADPDLIALVALQAHERLVQQKPLVAVLAEDLVRAQALGVGHQQVLFGENWERLEALEVAQEFRAHRRAL
jgi:hypothetical protein